MAKVLSLREVQLERKLQLLLGTGPDWLKIYGEWLAENDCDEAQGYDDHQINLFVSIQKRSRRNAVR